MNDVNVTNQLRNYYSTFRIRHFKISQFLWHYFFDITMCNNYKIENIILQKSWNDDWNHNRHKHLRMQFAEQLFVNFERLIKFVGSFNDIKRKSLTNQIVKVSERKHKFIKLDIKSIVCIICTVLRFRVQKQSKIRISLQKLSNNSKRADKRRVRISKSLYDCELYDVYLCNHKHCWNRHLNVI